MPHRRRMRPMRHGPSVATLFETPFGAYEKHLMRAYALTVFTPDKGKRKREVGDELIEWYRVNRANLGYRVAPLDLLLERRQDERDFCGTIALRYTRRTWPVYEAAAPARSALQLRIDWVARTLGLSTNEAALLGAVARLIHVPVFRVFYEAAMEGHCTDGEVQVRNAAHIAGLGDRDAYRLADLRGPMFQLGLLEDRGGGDVGVSATVLDLLSRRTTDPDVLRRALLGETAESSLSMADFAHLGAARDQAVALVDGALQARTPGASILLYGPPGTGKTEFARAIGDETGAHVVFIGERNAEDDGRPRRAEPSRADRLAHLAFVSALAERAGRVVLVIDEADDVFTGVDDDDWMNRTGSKVFMNRVVETCPVPIVWITNHASRLGPAVLRRMLFAIPFRPADRSTRARIVARHAEAENVALGEAGIARLAALPASPAVLQTGVRAASILKANGEDAANLAVSVARSLLKVAGNDRAPDALAGPMAFDASLSNADMDLVELEERVLRAGAGALSFLFSGLPGTGKSAFARHLAERLGMEVMHKRASDLLGMWVGESEKNIAEAFAEAADTRRFMILDEADSLLSDRAEARQSWQVSQVNEMLTWMERHPMPFAATTNLATRLDPATQRRFLFKVTFDAMTAAQIERAFRCAFGVQAPTEVTRLSCLTPGDFAVVARKAKVLGIGEPPALGAMLKDEVAAKPDVPARIGF